MTTTNTETDRIMENLAYIAANPSVIFPAGWVAEVKAEAVAFGLISASSVGTECRPGIDRGIVYGGDMVDAF